MRRVGTLVARGVEPSEVVGAVAEEMRQCVGAFTAGLWRFDTSAEITLVAAAADPALRLPSGPLGTRTPIEGNTLATVVHRTGLPARIDSYENIAGLVAARVRAVGVRAAVGVPIIVDGSVWGLAAVGSAGTRPHAGRHRDAHQPVRRTDRHCSGGGIPRRAEEAAPGRDIATSVPD